MVLQSRVREADTLQLIGDADRDGDVVHAGTYFGDFIPALSRSRESGAIVWAFEPSRENYRCAQITTMLNDLDNVVLTHAALDSHDGGSAILQTSNPQGVPLGGESRIVIDPDRARGQTKEEVQLVTVDEVIARDRRVAIIQLDVEGHEQRALAGAIKTIERWRPLIVVETMPERAWVAINLAPLGYERDGSVDMNKVLRCRRRS